MALPRSLRWVLFYLVTATVVLAFVFPLVWAALRTLQPASLFFAAPSLASFADLTLENWAKLFTGTTPVLPHARNSLLVSGLTAVTTSTLATLGGYGFARFPFRGSEILFAMMLGTLMIPFQSLLAPLFVFLRAVNLNDSLLGLVLLYTAFQVPFGLFVMRNAFRHIPEGLEEAAQIDGASTLGILRRILLPIVAPSVVSVALFSFVFAWNEFLAALTFLTTQEHYTLPVVLSGLAYGTYGEVDYSALQTGAVLSMVPCLVLFLALQRFYVSGLVSGSVKT